MQPVIEETAAKLAATDPALDERVPDQLFGLDRRGRLPPLAGAGRGDPDQARRRLREGPQRPPRAPGYSKEWLREVVKHRPDQFKLPENGKPVETDH